MTQNQPVALPASLLAAFDPPARHVQAILDAAALRARQAAVQILPVLAFPVLVLAAAVPAWVSSASTGNEWTLVPSGPHAGVYWAVVVGAWIAWATAFVLMWPQLRSVTTLAAMRQMVTVEPSNRIGMAFRPYDPAYLPTDEIRDWAQSALEDLALPIVNDGAVSRPDDTAIAGALIFRVVLATQPATALDHGRVRLAQQLVEDLAQGGRSRRHHARHLAYTMLTLTPSHFCESLVNCTALECVDPALVQRDLSAISTLAETPSPSLGDLSTRPAVAGALRLYQELLVHASADNRAVAERAQ